ncbi:MAG: flagellar protein [Candidatus Kapabacteria bacterium]|nr:flagellar protein [Candidatus Kapabacteria bacterium]
MDVNGVNLPFIPAGGLNELTKNFVQRDPVSGSSFEEIFKEELSKIKFSSHAQSRLVSREITLNEADIERLQNSVKVAESKGARESLVILDEKAFIISIPNRTVITVVNRDQLEQNVVTDIDSAVFA